MYLHFAYIKFIKNEEMPFSLTIIATCSVHVLKFFADHLKIFDKTSKEILLANFAKCITSPSYDFFLHSFACLYIALEFDSIPVNILCMLRDNSGLSEGLLDSISEIIDTTKNESTFEEATLDFGGDSNFDAKNSLYMNSSYIKDIEHKVQNLLSIKSNLVSNKFVSKKLSKYLLRKLGPFNILWSSYIHKR